MSPRRTKAFATVSVLCAVSLGLAACGSGTATVSGSAGGQPKQGGPSSCSGAATWTTSTQRAPTTQPATRWSGRLRGSCSAIRHRPTRQRLIPPSLTSRRPCPLRPMAASASTARPTRSTSARAFSGTPAQPARPPVAQTELFARARALTRRGGVERPAVITVGDIVLDPARHAVSRAGVEVRLSSKEFPLLHQLMRHPGEVLSRTHLIDHVRDTACEGGPAVVDVYVRYLREKLDRPFGRASIETVRGTGYRLHTS